MGVGGRGHTNGKVSLGGWNIVKADAVMKGRAHQTGPLAVAHQAPEGIAAVGHKVIVIQVTRGRYENPVGRIVAVKEIDEVFAGMGGD